MDVHVSSFFFYLDGLGSLARSCSEFINSKIMNLIDSQYDSFDGSSARRKATTYTGQHKHRIMQREIHASSVI
jgi:hypothetical protein